jgi:uncharacterized protein YeaO (DUF488 family)
MSPLHRRPNGVDKIIQDSTELRAQLTATVEELERFVAEFVKEIELEEQQQQREPGVGEDDE